MQLERHELIELARFVVAEGGAALETVPSIQRQRWVESRPRSRLQRDAPIPTSARERKQVLQNRRAHALA